MRNGGSVEGRGITNGRSVGVGVASVDVGVGSTVGGY
jgi:hypothetical protein